MLKEIRNPSVPRASETVLVLLRLISLNLLRSRMVAPKARTGTSIWVGKFVMIKKPDSLRSLGKRDVVRLAIGGILEVGIGGTLLFLSLKLGDASRTIPLLSTTPLFALVLAAQYAGEKMSPRLLIGTVVIVAGIVMIASSAMV